ncbi:SusC/RagA family TonB-linked outer membrane protein, partial [Bacteroides acidifaciens]|uniref:SusC/RagA family TonB-linked outer membrane protein n=2 Tax=Bacteroidales TaxID=171549 RepID=UPI0026F26ECB
TLYPDQDHGADTDWIDEISRTPVSHVHNLSLMGGNSKTNYIANLNYASRQGIMKKSDFESFQGRIEVTHRMFDDKLKLKFGLFGKKNQMESTTNGGSFRGWVYGQATRRNPTDPVRNEDGTWNENVSKFEYENPLALLYEAEGNVKKTQLRYNGNIVYNPIKDLTLSAVFSYIRDNMNRGYGETLNHISALRDGLAGWSSVGAYTKMEKLMELTAQYSKEIGAHKFTVLGGYSYNETDFEELWIDNYGFQDDYFGGWHNIGIGSALKDGKANIGSKKTPTNLIGFFGRATYSFKNRYLLMGALRYEGASQLWGTDNAWGLFPSVSVGWRITEEAFMKNQKIFDDLKLRVGYGVTGSQPKNPFLGVAMLKYGSYAFVNGNWIQTIVPASNPNPDLKWEEKKETNIGLDFVSWGGRLSGSIDYYNRDVDGLIYEYGVPTPPNLYNKTMANGGTMRNRGVEVLVTVVPVQNKDFEWSTTGTFSLNSNKLISLSGSIFKSDYDYFNTGTVEYSGQVADSHRVQVGESIGNFYGFKVVDVDSEGRWIYEDRNGELVNYKDFTHAPEDKHVIGNGLPKWYAGWNNTLRYKNFDLNVTMRGAFGFQIINGGRMNYENVKNSRFENRLKSVNDLVFGKHTLSSEVEPEFNSYYVENGDYWKIDNITLGYSFGQVGKYIKSLRVYGSVLNALTITGYKGIDPEVSTDGLTPGYDTRDRYPSVRSFTFGVNVKF